MSPKLLPIQQEHIRATGLAKRLRGVWILGTALGTGLMLLTCWALQSGAAPTPDRRAEVEKQQQIVQAAQDAVAQLTQLVAQTKSRMENLPAGSEKKRAAQDLQLAQKRLQSAQLAEQSTQAELSRLQSSAHGAKATGKNAATPEIERMGAAISDIRYLEEEGTARVQIYLRGKVRHELDNDRKNPVLTIVGASLPKLLQRTLDTSEFGGAVKSVSSFTDASDRTKVYVKVALQAGYRQTKAEVKRTKDGLVWELSSPVSRAAKANAGRGLAERNLGRSETLYDYRQPQVAAAESRRRGGGAGGNSARFTGRRIDLDFKDADLHNILRLLSDVGNVNIITSDKVQGKVTIRMRNVPWDQALDVILRAKDLGQVREGNLIRVAPMTDLEKERESEIARLKQVVMLKPLETRLIPLSYAKAEEMSAKLQHLQSPRGKVSIDTRTNTLIARDVSDNLNLMEKLIQNLDTQTPQVLIEVRIVEASSSYRRQMGIQWGGNWTASPANGNATGLAFPNQMGIGGGATDGDTPTGGLLLGQAANTNFAVNLPASAGTGNGGALGLTMGSVSGNVNINLRLSAMEASGELRIISSPKIITLDNIEAKIEQGIQLPYESVSAMGTQTTFRDATLALTVRPHVTAEGSVFMKILATNNEPDDTRKNAKGEPGITKKEARTELLIRDGDTAVIGGIYKNKVGSSRKGIPWFMDIPILGYFFKFQEKTNEQAEMLIFITPRIVNRPQSLGR